MIISIFAVEGELYGPVGPGMVDIEGEITVPQGRTLELRPGTVMRFSGFSGITVKGSLKVEGTQSLPVVLTSINDSRYGGNGAEPLDWNSIVITASAGECIFKFAEISYSSDCIQSVVDGCRFDNVLLRNNGTNKVVCGRSVINADGNGIVSNIIKVAVVEPLVKEQVKVHNKKGRIYAAVGVAVAAATTVGVLLYNSDKDDKTENPIITDPAAPPNRN